METSARENRSCYELRQHKIWFDEEHSKLLDERKQDKLQLLQNSSQINGDTLSNLRCETKRTSKNEKKKSII
jgi:hypothetical protein